MTETIKDAEMPGAWICDKCKYELHNKVILTNDGSIRANTSPINHPCPNDGQLMRPITWREMNERLYDRAALEILRINWLDEHCSFVADYPYNLGPFGRGELRKLADAGLAADGAKEGVC